MILDISDQRSILQLLTECSDHPGDAFLSASFDEQVKLLSPLYNRLIEMLPEPPSSSEPISPPVKVSFSAFSLECLMYSLLALVRFCPKFLCNAATGDDKIAVEGTARLQALRQKIQYTALLIQSHRSSIILELQAAFQVDGLSSVSTAEEARCVSV